MRREKSIQVGIDKIAFCKLLKINRNQCFKIGWEAKILILTEIYNLLTAKGVK